MIGHLNINSIRNKFEMLQFLLADYIDILMTSIDWIETIEEEECYCL